MLASRDPLGLTVEGENRGWGQRIHWSYINVPCVCSNAMKLWGLISRNQSSNRSLCQSLFRDFWADKTFPTRWSGGRVQVWVQVWAPASHLAITLKGFFRRQLKVLTARSMVKKLTLALGAALLHSLGWSGRQAPTQDVSTLEAVSAGRNLLGWEKMLPLLQYWLSSTVKKVLMLCNFWVMTLVTTDFFHFKLKLNFWCS